jgi:hypothetical protein
VRRAIVILLAASALIALGSVARGVGETYPVGPGGSTYVGGQVTCGTRQTPGRIAGIHVHNFEGGIEVCLDEATGLPVEGRAMLGSSPGGLLGDTETPDHVTVQTDADTVVVGDAVDVHIPLPPEI